MNYRSKDHSHILVIAYLEGNDYKVQSPDVILNSLAEPNKWQVFNIYLPETESHYLQEGVVDKSNKPVFILVTISNQEQYDKVLESEWYQREVKNHNVTIEFVTLKPGYYLIPEYINRAIYIYEANKQHVDRKMLFKETTMAKSKIVSIFNTSSSVRSKRMAEATEYLEALIDADTVPIGINLESNVALFSNLKSSINQIRDQLEQTLYDDKKFVVFVVFNESTLKELIAYLIREEKFKDLLHSNIKVTTPSQVSNFYNPKLPKTLLKACINRHCNTSDEGDKYVVDVEQDSSGQYVYKSVVSQDVCAKLRGLWIKKDPDLKPYDIKFVADDLELTIKYVSKDIVEPIKVTDKSNFIKAVLDSNSVDIDEDIRNRLLKAI